MSSTSRIEWIQTFSGRQFWPMEPRVEDIDIGDIAHSLSNQCRFNGHCKTFYSVAQHSVLVSRHCDPADQLWGLLHDAAEAYLVDLPRPVKHTAALTPFRDYEKRIQAAICARFGLPIEQPESVSRIDKSLLRNEQRDLMSPAPAEWLDCRAGAIDNLKIHPWSPSYAKHCFMYRFMGLTRSRDARGRTRDPRKDQL